MEYFRLVRDFHKRLAPPISQTWIPNEVYRHLSSSIGLRITGYALRTIPRLPPFENVPINLGMKKDRSLKFHERQKLNNRWGTKSLDTLFRSFFRNEINFFFYF